MSDIYVFGASEDSNDYASMGLVGALTPTKCTFTEAANGESTIELEHPIDDFGRYRALVRDNILVVPVPVLTPPEITAANTCVTQVWKYKVKGKGQLSGDAQRYLYKAKKGSGRKAVLAYDQEVIVVAERDKPAPARWKVRVPAGSTLNKKKIKKDVSGWVNPDGFDYVNSIVIPDNSQAIQEVASPWSVAAQYFRIFEEDKTDLGVTVKARHIRYDLLYTLTNYESAEEVDLPTALGALNDDDGKVAKPTGIFGLTYTDHPFMAHTNVKNARAGLFHKRKNIIETLLDPEEGICARFGVGMFADNYDLYFVNDPGLNRGVRIQYRKNMLGVKCEIDVDGVITRIVPVGETKDGKPLLLHDTDMTKQVVDSPFINDYPIIRTYELECQNCKVGQKEKGGGTLSTAEARARMKQQALDMFSTVVNGKVTKQGADLPSIKMEVDYIVLGDTQEYSYFKGLENTYLWDYIAIQHPDLQIDLTSRIVEIQWDVLTDRMIGCTLGEIGVTNTNVGITSWQIPTFSGSKIAAGSVSGAAFEDDIISARHVQAESINAEAIQAGSVTAEKIAAGSVTAEKIEAGSITGDRIKGGTITGDLIQGGTITGENIMAGTVTATNLDAVTVDAMIADITNATIEHAVIKTAQIEDGAITNAKIANEAVTNSKIQDATITGAKIKDASIDTAQIALAAITAALIKDGAVGTLQIADASITDAKVVDLSANSITAGTLSVERLIIVGSDKSIVYAINEANGTPQLSSETIDGGSLTQRTITADRIVSKAITAEEIAAHSITANEILANTITAAEIAAATITSQEIAANTITVSNLQPNVGEQLNINGNTAITALDDRMSSAELKITPEAITAVVTGSSDYQNFENSAVETVKNQYYLSLSPTVVTGGTWSDVAPAWEDGKYMWSRTVTKYYTGRTVTSDPTCIAGATGQNGSDGKGVKSVVAYYAVSASNTTAPTTWSTTMQTMTATNKYLWSYEKTTYTDNTSLDSTKVVIGVYGDPGAAGVDGKGISAIVQYYLATSQGSGVTTSTSGWTTTVQTMTATNKYLWNYTRTSYTDSSSTATTPLILGVFGNDGAAGADGKGIASIVEFYQISASNSTAPTTWVQTTPPVMTATNKYLWNYTRTNFTDGTFIETAKTVIGAYGDKGADGAAGKGVLTIAEYYAVSASNTTAPTTWTQTVPSMTATNKYLWNYTRTTYTDTTYVETNKVVIGVYGDKGQDGGTGPAGAAGTGIQTITQYYLATSLSTGVTTSTPGWTTTVQTQTPTNKYLWNYTRTLFTDTSTTTTTPGVIGVYGDAGAPGAAGVGIKSIAVQYYLSTSKTTQTGGSWVSTMPIWVSGTYVWTRDMITYTDNTVSYTSPYCDTGWEAATNMADELFAEIEITNGTIAQKVGINDLTRYLNFDAITGVVIGDTLQPYNVQILSDRVNIRNQSKVVAYFAQDKFYIDQGELITSLKIGNYYLKASSDGGLAIG